MSQEIRYQRNIALGLPFDWKSRALLALGSNSGDRHEHLNRAVQLLREVPHSKVTAVSSWQATKPAGGPMQDEFLNGAVTIETELDESDLFFNYVQPIENELGRVRDIRWGPRTIDLDLLLYDECQIVTTTVYLKVPHPRMAFRRFVLAPACEIAADWVYPINGATLAELIARLDSTPQRIAIVGMDQSFEIVAQEVRRQYPHWQLVDEWIDDTALRLVICTSANVSAEQFEEFARREKSRNSPPVLWCANSAPDWILQEVLAAIVAME